MFSFKISISSKILSGNKTMVFVCTYLSTNKSFRVSERYAKFTKKNLNHVGKKTNKMTTVGQNI